jgi:hypothetical protein
MRVPPFFFFLLIFFKKIEEEREEEEERVEHTSGLFGLLLGVPGKNLGLVSMS